MSFDCSNYTGTLHGRVKEINILELFKATETKQKREKATLRSVRGVATQKSQLLHRRLLSLQRYNRT